MTRRDHSDAEIVEAALRRARDHDDISRQALLIVAVLLGWFLLALIIALSIRLVEVLRA